MKCLANKEGEQCDQPVVSHGRCKYHQVYLPKDRKKYPCMKTHKMKRRDAKRTV